VTTAAASDPFETTANPARYVPRPASERALGAIELALVQGSGPILLTGPPGIGKTMLLGVLSRRLAETYRIVRVPYAALSGPEICRWVLHELHDEGPREDGGGDPEGALLDRAFREAAMGRELLLLVDDATALPPGAARSLVTLVSASGGAVRAVLAAVDDDRLADTRVSLGSDVREIRFDAPMDADETAAYVRARIAAVEDPGEGPRDPRAARFDADTLARLYGATGGVPRRVHELGSLLWRGEHTAGLPERIAAWVREEQGEPTPSAAPVGDAAPGPEAPVADAAPAPEPPDTGPVSTDAASEPADASGPSDTGRGSPAAAPGPPEVEPAAAEPVFEPMGDRDAGAGQGAGPAPPEPPPAGRRTRGLWFALIGLGLLVVALPYARPALEDWIEAGLTPAPSATRPPVPPPPEAPAPTPLEGEEPDAETGLADPVSVEPDTAPLDGEDASFEDAAPLEPGEDATAPIASEEPDAELIDASSEPPPETEPAAAATPPAPGPSSEPGAPPQTGVPRAPPPGPNAAAQHEPPPSPEPTVATTPAPPSEPGVAPTPAPPSEPTVPTPAPPSEPAVAPTPTPAPQPEPEPQPRAEAKAAATPAPSAPRPAPGELLVRIEGAPGARVYVDGGVVGETPLDAISLSPGLHVFRAEFPGGRIMVRAVEISAASRVVDMEPPR
jgi:hypothetical protein